jgi:F-type H+-transporting ATPase subunit b
MTIFRDPEFWVLVSFVLFVVLFGTRLWKAIAAILDGRADAIRTELAEAAKLRAEAEQMLRDAQAARAAALDEARALVQSARAEAARVGQAAHEEAENAAKRRERMALDRIEAAEKAAVTEMRQTAADIAVQAARAVIAQTLSSDDDAEIVDRAIASLPQALRAA